MRLSMLITLPKLKGSVGPKKYGNARRSYLTHKFQNVKRNLKSAGKRPSSRGAKSVLMKKESGICLCAEISKLKRKRMSG